MVLGREREEATVGQSHTPGERAEPGPALLATQGGVPLRTLRFPGSLEHSVIDQGQKVN